MIFKNRVEAGKKLSEKLSEYKGKDVVVYALPRGGVVLGYEIAKFLDAPLDIIMSKKVGHPLMPEYGVCAVSEKGEPMCNEEERISLNQEEFDKLIEEKRKEAGEKKDKYLEGLESIDGSNKIAILVDDGIATGLTFRHAIQKLKEKKPKSIVAAVPVSPLEIVDQIRKEVDEVVVLDAPKYFQSAVGAYYENFDQVSDESVIQFLKKNRE